MTLKIAHISIGGPNLFIKVDGNLFRFEMHPRFGPCPLTPTGIEKRGDHPLRFWRAVQRWSNQGRRLKGNACVWDEPNQRVETTK